MTHSRALCAFVLVLAVGIGPLTAHARQASGDRDAIWADFMTCFKAAPLNGSPVAGYVTRLEATGVPKPEIERRVAVVMTLLQERVDWVEVYFDKTYGRPLTGEVERDGFSTKPSALLVDATRGLPPGRALDAGMGQGRNALFLARNGWAVTGFDISGGAVRAAEANARAAGVSIKAVQASYDTFDYGVGRWDLIVLAFAWAPVSDPGFVARLHAALRPGGKVVFEHFVEDAGHPRPGPVRAVPPGQLPKWFGQFFIDRYEEVDDVGDWGGPGSRLARMVASRPR
jgi:SAM-dependent methyltransferase